MVETIHPQTMGEFNSNNNKKEIEEEKIRLEELELFLRSKVFKEHNVIHDLKITRGEEDIWTHFADCYSHSNEEENVKKYSIKENTIAYIPSKNVYCLVENVQENIELLEDLGFKEGNFEAFSLEEEDILEGDMMHIIKEDFNELMGKE